MFEETQTPKVTRSSPYGLASSQAAKAAMAPFNERIAVWQVALAKMRGAALSKYGLDASAVLLAREIELEAMMELGKLREVIAGLDDKVAASSRVQDTTRALETISNVARALLSAAGPG
jgi:hypothetical protein